MVTHPSNAEVLQARVVFVENNFIDGCRTNKQSILSLFHCEHGACGTTIEWTNHDRFLVSFLRLTQAVVDRTEVEFGQFSILTCIQNSVTIIIIYFENIRFFHAKLELNVCPISSPSLNTAHSHHHHRHLFLKHPFLLRSAKVRRFSRNEALPHISEHCPFSIQHL